jgi:hypothetical protein
LAHCRAWLVGTARSAAIETPVRASQAPPPPSLLAHAIWLLRVSCMPAACSSIRVGLRDSDRPGTPALPRRPGPPGPPGHARPFPRHVPPGTGSRPDLAARAVECAELCVGSARLLAALRGGLLSPLPVTHCRLVPGPLQGATTPRARPPSGHPNPRGARCLPRNAGRENGRNAGTPRHTRISRGRPPHLRCDKGIMLIEMLQYADSL